MRTRTPAIMRTFSVVEPVAGNSSGISTVNESPTVSTASPSGLITWSPATGLVVVVAATVVVGAAVVVAATVVVVPSLTVVVVDCSTVVVVDSSTVVDVVDEDDVELVDDDDDEVELVEDDVVVVDCATTALLIETSIEPLLQLSASEHARSSTRMWYGDPGIEPADLSTPQSLCDATCPPHARTAVECVAVNQTETPAVL